MLVQVARDIVVTDLDMAEEILQSLGRLATAGLEPFGLIR